MTTVVITGANRGIGLSFAKYYKAQGWDVWALCRHASSDLESLGVNVVQEIDVSDDAVGGKLKQSLAGVCIDLLINNAGILDREELGSLDFDVIREQFEVNALSPIRVVSTLKNDLADGAQLAFITSRMGSIADNGSGGAYGYRMSKAALNMAATSIARDLADLKVSVLILHPGMVSTEMIGGNGQIEPEEAARGLLTRIEEHSFEKSGQFLHQNGDPLPW